MINTSTILMNINNQIWGNKSMLIKKVLNPGYINQNKLNKKLLEHFVARNILDRKRV